MLPIASAMPAQFSVPEVEDNVEGWGPISIPDHLSGVPYAPFGKSDKVGKISDFTQAGGKYGGNLIRIKHNKLRLTTRLTFSKGSAP